jgi:hypothetical protein
MAGARRGGLLPRRGALSGTTGGRATGVAVVQQQQQRRQRQPVPGRLREWAAPGRSIRSKQGKGAVETMRSIKIAGLALVAVFAFSAIAAGSAFAESGPKLMVCKKAEKNSEHHYLGTYRKATPTEEAEGKKSECAPEQKATALEESEGVNNEYTLEQPEPATVFPFTGKSKSVVITAKGEGGTWQVIVCGKSTVAGELNNDSEGIGVEAGAKVTFSKCVGKSAGKEVACGNEEPELGKGPVLKVETGGKGVVVWLEEGEVKPALYLPAGEPSSFECPYAGGEKVEVYGVLGGAIENTPKGMNLSWTVGGERHAQAANYFWEVFPHELNENFYYTRWYTGGEEVTEEQEATVAGMEVLKTTTKGVSVRKASEAS